MHLFAMRKHETEGNWKLVLDTFLEGYHVIRLHAAQPWTTVRRHGGPCRPASVHTCAKRRHGLASPRGQLKVQVARSTTCASIVTYVYTLFPNAALICSQDYCNLLIMQPKGIGKTVVHNFMLTNVNPQGEKLRKKWEKSLALTDGLAFPEDFAASAATYQGLTTGVVKELIIGGMEVGISIFMMCWN